VESEVSGRVEALMVEMGLRQPGPDYCKDIPIYRAFVWDSVSPLFRCSSMIIERAMAETFKINPNVFKGKDYGTMMEGETWTFHLYDYKVMVHVHINYSGQLVIETGPL
jgi:hypothetical protein